METNRQFLRMNQAADLLGISRRTLERWVGEHEIAHAKINGTVLIRRDVLEAFVDEHAVPAESRRVVSVAG